MRDCVQSLTPARKALLRTYGKPWTSLAPKESIMECAVWRTRALLIASSQNRFR